MKIVIEIPEGRGKNLHECICRHCSKPFQGKSKPCSPDVCIHCGLELDAKDICKVIGSRAKVDIAKDDGIIKHEYVDVCVNMKVTS